MGLKIKTQDGYIPVSTSVHSVNGKAGSVNLTASDIKIVGTDKSIKQYVDESVNEISVNSIPVASATILGGIRVGTGLSINNGVLSVTNPSNGELIADTDYLTPGTASSTYQSILTQQDKQNIADLHNDAVQSVNGKTGTVSLTASDVGALPNTTSIPDSLDDLTDDSTHRLVTDTEKETWNAKQSALTADTDYLTPDTASSTYQLILTDEDKQTIANLGNEVAYFATSGKVYRWSNTTEYSFSDASADAQTGKLQLAYNQADAYLYTISMFSKSEIDFYTTKNAGRKYIWWTSSGTITKGENTWANAVTSVNTKTGAVVLTADDIKIADSTDSIKDYVDNEISNMSEDTFVITVTGANDDGDVFYTDKTYEEIVAANQNGKRLYLKNSYENTDCVYYLPLIYVYNETDFNFYYSGIGGVIYRYLIYENGDSGYAYADYEPWYINSGDIKYTYSSYSNTDGTIGKALDTIKSRVDTLTDDYIISILPKYDGSVV